MIAVYNTVTRCIIDQVALVAESADAADSKSATERYVGSIPTGSTQFAEVAQRPESQISNLLVVGSNPIFRSDFSIDR